jgi:hypothetical protein
MTKIKLIDVEKHEITVDGDHLEWIGKVRTFDADIHSFESRIKTLREQLVEEIENTDEYDEVLELQEKLKTARDNLKRRLESNQTYMDLTEDLANEKLSLKDAQANMSDFLLGYFADTHERQIELGPANAREVILKGKLGKPKDFQTNLFSKPPINTNHGRKDL